MKPLNVIRTGLLAGALLVVAACGGTPATSPAQSPAGPGVTATPGQPTPTGQQPGGAGQGVQDPCGLITVEEVSSALGTDAVTAEEDAGGTTTACNYRTADGTLLLATTYSDDPSNPTAFSTLAGVDGALPVPGLGDQAVVSGDSLYLLAGDALVVIQVGPTALSELDAQQLIQALTSLGQSVAGRL